MNKQLQSNALCEFDGMWAVKRGKELNKGFRWVYVEELEVKAMWEKALDVVHGIESDDIVEMQWEKHSTREKRGKFKIYAINGSIDTIDKGFAVRKKCSKDVKKSTDVAVAVKDCVPIMV